MPAETETKPTSTDVLDPKAVTAALAPETDQVSPEAKYIAGLPADEKLIAIKILPMLREAASKGNEVTIAKRLQELQAQFQKEAQDAIQAEIQKLRDSNKPPSNDELEKLLNQEYITFTIKIRGRDEEFVIQELTQEIEIKFLKTINKKILPYVKELTSVEWTSGTFETRLKRMLEIIPDGLGLLTDLAVVALDPDGDKNISADYLKKHLSSSRIMQIVEAQVVAGRIRDFLSVGSRLFPSKMIG